MSEATPAPQSANTCTAPHKTEDAVEVASIPRALVWAMGGLALMLLLSGTGVLLLQWWDALHVGVRVAALLVPVVLLWSGYGIAAGQGVRSGEVVGAFACITWLVALLVWQCLVPETPPWLPGVLFGVGALLVAVFFPNRTSVVMLAVSTVAELAVVWYGMTSAGEHVPGVLLWAGVVAVLCLWGLGGFMCGLTRHVVYAPYAFLGPLMFSLYLLSLQGVILYLPEVPAGGWSQWGYVALLWLAPVVVFCAVHRMLAARRGKPVLSWSFLTVLLAMYAVLPIGLWANRMLPMVPGVLLLFVYALCLVRYGAAYQSPYFIVSGCTLAFLSAVGVAFGQGGSLMGGGVTLLLLGVFFAWLACRLYRQRRRLVVAVALAKKRQESAREKEASALARSPEA